MKLPPWAKRVWFWLSVIAGVAAFLGVLKFYKLNVIIDQVAEVGWPCVAAYTGTALFSLLIPAIGWQILLRAEGVRASTWTLMKANLMGFVLNIVTPSLYLGGEPLKTFYVAGVTGASKRRILATIIVSKFQEFVGVVGGMLIAVFVFISMTEVLKKTHEVVLVIVALTFAAGLMLWLYAIVGRLRPTIWVIDKIARVRPMGRRISRIRRKAVELEYRVHAAFVHRWKRFLVAQFVTLLSSVAMFLRPVVFVLFLGGAGHPHFYNICMIYIVLNVISMVQFIPGGLGMHEWGIAYYFDLISGTPYQDPVFTPETAMAYVLVSRFADVVFVLGGLGLLWHAGLMKFARGKEAIPMEDEEKHETVPLPEPGMKVLKRIFLAAHHEATGKTRRYVAGQLEPRPSTLRIGHVDGEEGFHLLTYRDNDSLMIDTFHRTLEQAMKQANEEFQVKPGEWEDVEPL